MRDPWAWVRMEEDSSRWCRRRRVCPWAAAAAGAVEQANKRKGTREKKRGPPRVPLLGWACQGDRGRGGAAKVGLPLLRAGSRQMPQGQGGTRHGRAAQGRTRHGRTQGTSPDGRDTETARHSGDGTRSVGLRFFFFFSLFDRGAGGRQPRSRKEIGVLEESANV